VGRAAPRHERRRRRNPWRRGRQRPGVDAQGEPAAAGVFASLFLSKCDFADGDPAAAGVFASVCFSLSLKVGFC
jgi:hypothetical protein